MTSYEDVINKVASELRETEMPLRTEKQLPQSMSSEENTSQLMNKIGLAINREGGMNI